MKNNKLTVIIPFLNEGVEVENTVRSIRETAGNEVDVLLINDCSTDDTDYVCVAKKYDAAYHKNAERKGVAEARNIGVSLIDTPYFILIDGHMRFYQNDWWKEFVRHLDENDRAVYSGTCPNLDINGAIKRSDKRAFGSYIHFTKCTPFNILEPLWISANHFPESSLIEIPCVLGASYAMSVRYWNYICGLEGLRYYGNDEPYLSMKVWLEGGKCYLLKNVEIGHIFRDEAPYRMMTANRIYNKLYISEMLLPPALAGQIEGRLSKNYPADFALAKSVIRKNSVSINKQKAYYNQIFTRNFSEFDNINKDEDYHVTTDVKLKYRLREIAAYLSQETESVGLMTGGMGAVVFLYEYAHFLQSPFYKRKADDKLNALLKTTEKNISHYNLYSGTAGLGLAFKYLNDRDYIDFDWQSYLAGVETQMLDYMRKLLADGNAGLMKGACGIASYFLELGVDVVDEQFAKSLEQFVNTSDNTMTTGVAGVFAFLLNVKRKMPENKHIDGLIETYLPKMETIAFEQKLTYESGDLIANYLLYNAAKMKNSKEIAEKYLASIIESCKRRDSIDESVLDAGIYEGSAGVALLYNIMYKESGCAELLAASRYWMDDLSCKANNMDYALFASHKHHQYDKGLLHGAAGIGLSILSIISNETPLWKQWIGL